MTEFEQILQECLLTMERGDANPEDCLKRHPQYALQLQPILLTTLDLDQGRTVRPPEAFKSRVRARLTQEMRAYPRRRARLHFTWMRLAVNFAAIVLALLVAGTVYAQSALPGEVFYAWKLTSENLWRSLAPDPVTTDLVLAERRATELLVVGNNLELRAQVLEAYLEVIHRLELETDAENEELIRSVLNAQIEELEAAGIFLSPSEENSFPALEVPSSIPTQTPRPTPLLPEVNPTLPVSTIHSLQETIETAIPAYPETVSTISVPPLLP